MLTFNHVMRKFVQLSLFLLIPLSASYGITITGEVTDFINKEKINQAEVAIFNEDTGIRDTVFTNTSGFWEYEFNAIAVDFFTQQPHTFSVAQNYPNPFNPSTVIGFENPEPGEVEVLVHNTLGQLVDSKRGYLAAGNYSIKWQNKGSAGIYFYTIRINNASITKKMMQLDGGTGSGLSGFFIGNENPTRVLNRPLLIPVTIIVSKFGYISDTLETQVLGGENLTTAIETIHSHATVVDLHNDVLEKMVDQPYYHLKDWHNYNHTDIPRLIEGGVDIQFFAAWVDYRAYSQYYQQTLNMINIFTSEINANLEHIGQAHSASEALTLNSEHKISAVLAVEGGHSIENSIENLIALYEAGVRYMTITWNNSTDWAVSAEDSRTTTVGLSDFGRKVIRTMDSLGVIIDVSHTGIKTIEDILETTKNPIVATHSGVRALKDHYRNLYDNQIIGIANSGGVIGIVFYPPYLGNGTAYISTVIKHIDYIVKLVSIDYVALGSDFDGIGTNTVVGLNDVSKFPDLTFALLEHGYSRSDVEKILGTNFLRVFRQVCGE